MAETLPIVNSIDDLKASNKVDSEKLRNTIKIGLFDVVKSINRMTSVRAPTATRETAAEQVSREALANEPHIWDKISTFFEMQTAGGAKKLVEAEERVAKSELEVAQAQREAAEKVSDAYTTQADAQANFTAAYETSMGQQAKVGMSQFTVFRTMAETFGGMKELLSGIQEILTTESNRKTSADLRLIWLTEQMLDIWRSGKPDLEYEAKKQMFRLHQEQYADEMQHINRRQQELLNAPNEALLKLEEELQKFLNMSVVAQKGTAEEIIKAAEEADQNQEQQLSFFERVFGRRGWFIDSFGSLRKSQEELNATAEKISKRQEQEAEEGSGAGAGAIAMTLALLASPLLWKAAYYGMAAYGAGKIFEGAKQGYEIATKPEEEWSPETKAEWERMQTERKKDVRESMRRMGHDIGPEEDPDSPVNKSKFFWGQMYDYVPDWMKTTEGNQDDPGILDAGKEFWNKIIGSGEEAAKSATAGEPDIEYAVPVQVVNEPPRTLESAAAKNGAEVNVRSSEVGSSFKNPSYVKGGDHLDQSVNDNSVKNNTNIFSPPSASATNRQSSSGGGMFARDLMLAQ